jgi:hypothetical protein
MGLSEGELAEFFGRLRLLAGQWERKTDYFAGLSEHPDDVFACYASLYRNATADLLGIVNPTADRMRQEPRRAPRKAGEGA